MTNEKDLLEKRAGVYKQMEDITAKAKAEARDFTKEELDSFDKADADFEMLTRQIETGKKLEARNKDLAIQKEAEERTLTPDSAKEKQLRSKTFRKWMVSGMQELTPEERSIMIAMKGKDAEGRAMSSTGSAGGYTIPEGFKAELEKALKYYGNVREVSRILSTETGNDIPYPMVNDTANSGELLAEGSAAGTEVDPTFAVKTLKAYKWSSKPILVSLELLQDSAFNLEQYLAEAFGERIGRIENTYFTTGTGTAQPEGVVTGANGTGVTNAAAAAIAYTDLLNLYHALDPKYRKDAQWMFNDSTLKAIKLLSIGTNYTLPLWQPSLAAGDPDTIMGKKYGINNDMAAIGASAISTLFGDFSKCIIRDVKSFMMMNRMQEKYIESGQIGFIMFTRSSSHILNAGTNPIKKLTHAAS